MKRVFRFYLIGGGKHSSTMSADNPYKPSRGNISDPASNLNTPGKAGFNKVIFDTIRVYRDCVCLTFTSYSFVFNIQQSGALYFITI